MMLSDGQTDALEASTFALAPYLHLKLSCDLCTGFFYVLKLHMYM